MGVFKRYESVSSHHRLANHTAAYEGRNVWEEFCEGYEYYQGAGDRYEEEVDRVGGHWLEHMRSRGRHHALASPDDVESWCRSLLARRSVATAFHYWVRIRRFYDWLLWHVDHPHVYNPVLMAVREGEAASQIWEQKLQKWRNARGDN